MLKYACQIYDAVMYSFYLCDLMFVGCSQLWLFSVVRAVLGEAVAKNAQVNRRQSIFVYGLI